MSQLSDRSSSCSHLLTLREISGSIDVARRLPRDLAVRLHALPVAEDGDGVTVAMSDPSDNLAIQAIAEALGAKPCVVRGELETIDARLAEVWSVAPEQPLRLVALRQADSPASDILSYASYLAELVGGSLRELLVTGRAEAINLAARSELEEEPADLVVAGEPGESWIRRLLLGSSAGPIVSGVGTSSLVVRHPSSPIRNVLLVMGGSLPDLRAVDWVVRLARPAQASVTVLPVVPYLPAIAGAASRLVAGMPMLFGADAEEGRILKQVVARLTGSGIEGALRLRQGTPDCQVRSEAAGLPYDLVVVGSKPGTTSRLWSTDDLPLRVLRWTRIPVLVAK